MSSNRVAPATLEKMLTDGDEIALLDVREENAFGRGHLLLAINQPLSRLEFTIRPFVPRLSTRIVLCDEDDGTVERALPVLESAGYTDLHVLDGGVAAWSDAGYQLFDGTYVLEHAFGLFVEAEYTTPRISPQDLRTKLDAGENLVILDSRPFDEFQSGSLPGAIDLPLGEAVYRIQDVVPDPETQIVAFCAGVTRGTLLAQSLINAGITNPVMFLPDGTKGWYVSGESLVEGVSQATTDRSETAKAWSAQAPKQSSERFAARHIMPAELDAWRAESESRTLYIFDIRTREEYDDGHLADSIWIPGGQLVGFTQDYLATRNARICLVDNDCSRAELVAGWMLQIGWPEVVVLDGGIGDQGLVTGTTPLGVPELEKVQVPTISPTALAGRIQACTAVVIDFARSAQHIGGHVPGAWWMNRSSLPRLVGRLPTAQTYVATSASGGAGLLAAAELANLVDTPVMALDGGTAGWRAANLELSTGLLRPIGELDDSYMNFAERPGDDAATIDAASRRSGIWRKWLLAHYRNDSTLPFLA